MWKILEGLVPDLFPPICTKTSDRRGRTSIKSHINVGRLGTLEYNSFKWRAIRLFNQLPLFVRNTTVCSIHSFKKQLDSYLSTVTDSPCQPGLWILFEMASNTPFQCNAQVYKMYFLLFCCLLQE